MKILSKLMCVLLVCAMTVLSVVSMLPTQVYAATEGDYTYSVTDGEACIDGYKGPGGAVTIPSSLGGYPVTCIGSTSFSWSDLTTVTIPDSVVQIEDFAFMECEKLTNVYFGSGVAKISAYAFDLCSAITGFFVDERNPNYSSDEAGFLYNKDKTELVVAPKTVSGTYRIADSVVVIRNRAFDQCDNLEHLIISDRVEEIGHYAFSGNDALLSVHFGSSVTTIGRKAFSGCKKLTDLAIPDSVTTIGYSAFEYCDALTGTIRIPDGVTLVDSYLFDGCSQITAVVLGENVKQINDRAFGNCTGITTVYVPAALTQIGNNSFKTNGTIQTVYYGGSQSQWEKIRRGYGNDALLSGTIHFDHVHTTENPVEITAPHCRANGYGEYRCECADVRYGVIPATGHDYQQGVCTACGVQENGILGDIDGNQSVDIDDVVQLLLYVSMPDLFSIRTDGEFTNDGLITIDDVVQLLLHVSMPDLFPLQTEQ